MRVLQPAEWSKPRGFSHGVAVEGPGRWIVLAGQTGGVRLHRKLLSPPAPQKKQNSGPMAPATKACSRAASRAIRTPA